MQTLGALTVRKKFGAIINEVANKKVYITITKANKPLVVMLPIEDYEQIEVVRKKKNLSLQQVADKLNSWRVLHKEKMKDIDSTSIIRTMRETR
ncbi:type II toxin-antitoxin system Phd/YefM family antitoxin [Candidatus Desantisbacteria bacterium]|nr:type II toxin-antitoxin system Phd/YefM family antitoxin [Candidatus Desantisbacteria bacterium]